LFVSKKEYKNVVFKDANNSEIFENNRGLHMQNQEYLYAATMAETFPHL